MHYSSGFGSVLFVAGGTMLPGDGALQVAARVLLDGAGLLFGLYLLVAMGLSVAGIRLRRNARAHRMDARGGGPAAVGAHLGGRSPKLGDGGLR